MNASATINKLTNNPTINRTISKNLQHKRDVAAARVEAPTKAGMVHLLSRALKLLLTEQLDSSKSFGEKLIGDYLRKSMFKTHNQPNGSGKRSHRKSPALLIFVWMARIELKTIQNLKQFSLKPIETYRTVKQNSKLTS